MPDFFREVELRHLRSEFGGSREELVAKSIELERKLAQLKLEPQAAQNRNVIRTKARELEITKLKIQQYDEILQGLNSGSLRIVTEPAYRRLNGDQRRSAIKVTLTPAEQEKLERLTTRLNPGVLRGFFSLVFFVDGISRFGAAINGRDPGIAPGLYVTGTAFKAAGQAGLDAAERAWVSGRAGD